MKKAKGMILAIMMVLMTGLVSSQVMAGNGIGAGDGTGPMLNIYDGTPVTVTGVVSSLGLFGRGLEVDTGTEIVTVYGLGPIRYWDSIGVARPAVGETVTINGYEVTFSDGTTRTIATTITVGDQTINLRDPDTGAPLWRGSAGGNGGAAGTGQGGYGLRDGSCLMQ